MPENRNHDVDDFVDSAVRFGTKLGSGVLDSISQAMDDAGFGAARDPLMQTIRRLKRAAQQKYDNALGLCICGWIFCGCFAIPALVMTILMLALGGTMVFPILAVCFWLATAGFGWMGLAGSRKLKPAGLMRRLTRLLNNWTVSVEDLARALGCSAATLREEIYRGISSDALPGACLDDDGNVLYLDASQYQTVARPAAPTTDEQSLSQPERFRQEGTNFLHYLRSCEGQLDLTCDEELRTMQKTCGSIMGFIHNHPDQIERVRRFREYYIPTTRKLLDTARGLGGADTSNAQTIRRDITGILHTLNIAYTRLYDGLLQDISMDVSVEIDTLETMLNQDGLTHDFASDFGLNDHAKE